MRPCIYAFKRRKDGKIRYEEQYFNSRPQIVIDGIDISESLNLSQQKLLAGIAIWLREGSGWLVESINGHFINIVKYNPLRGNSYIPLPEQLRHGREVLVNIKNKDNECFRCCHVRQLNPQEVHPGNVKKSDRKMAQELNYQGVEFAVSVKDYHKIEVENSININVFGYESKQFYPIFVSFVF